MRATDDVMTERTLLVDVFGLEYGDEIPDGIERGSVRVCCGEWRREPDGRWRLYEFEDDELWPSRRNPD